MVVSPYWIFQHRPISCICASVFGVVLPFYFTTGTIRWAKKLRGRKKPLEKIENIAKKTGRKGRKGRRNAVSKSIGVSSDDGSKTRGGISEFSERKAKFIFINWKYFPFIRAYANADTNRKKEEETYSSTEFYIISKGAEWKDIDLPDIKNIFRRQRTEIDFRLTRFILFLECPEKSIDRCCKTDFARNLSDETVHLSIVLHSSDEKIEIGINFKIRRAYIYTCEK